MSMTCSATRATSVSSPSAGPWRSLRERQQQCIGQFGRLADGTFDALAEAFVGLVGKVLPHQQFGRRRDHRQWRAQFVADIGIELAVAFDQLGQAGRVVVERLGDLADASSSAKCGASGL